MINSIILAIGDILVAIVAVQAGFIIRFGAVEIPNEAHLMRLTIFSVVTVISSYFLELYNFERQSEKKELLARVFFAVVVSFILMTVTGYVVHVPLFFRGMFLVTLIAFGILQYLWHVSYRSILYSKGMAHKVLVLGTGPLAKKIGDLIVSTNHRHVLGGYINPTGESIHVPAHAVVGNGGGLLETIKRNKVDKMVVRSEEHTS